MIAAMSMTEIVLVLTMPVGSKTALQDLKRRINGGARLQLDGLSDEELAAMATLIMEGGAEIINEACKPFLIRKLAP